MKRNNLILTTAVIGLSALVATASLAHDYGQGQSMGQGMGQGMEQGQHQGQRMQQGHGGQFRGHKGNVERMETPLTIEGVRNHIEQRLELRGNDRLKVGNVTEVDENTIRAEIVTVDDSLVRAIEFDKETGRPNHANGPQGHMGPQMGQQGGLQSGTQN